MFSEAYTLWAEQKRKLPTVDKFRQVKKSVRIIEFQTRWSKKIP
jgi:hypothetical protein